MAAITSHNQKSLFVCNSFSLSMEGWAVCEWSSTVGVKCLMFGTWPLGGSTTLCFLSGSQRRVVEGLPNLLHDLTILCGFLFPFGKCVSHPMSHTPNLSKTLQYFPGFTKIALWQNFPPRMSQLRKWHWHRPPVFQAQIRIQHVSPEGLTKNTTDVKTTIWATVEAVTGGFQGQGLSDTKNVSLS